MAATDLALSNPRLSSPPAPLSPVMDTTIRHFTSKLTAVGLGHEIAATDAPSEQVREVLAHRVAILDRWLAPAQPADLVSEVGKIMFMPSQSGADDTKALVKLYVMDLCDLPLFAVVKACTHFRHGDGHWRPTQGEIRAKAIDFLADFHREKRRIESVLAAKVIEVRSDPERRRQVAELARLRIREMRDAEAEREKAARDAAQARDAFRECREFVAAKPETDEEFKARIASPVKLSEAALRTCPEARPAEAAE